MFRVHQHDSLVECAICGIYGSVTFEDGKPVYTFSEEAQEHSRLNYAGKLDHRNEIADGAMTQKKVENLKALKEKYLHVGE
jgi:hypothetical protein